MKKATLKLGLNIIMTITVMFTACKKNDTEDCPCSNQEYPSTANVLRCAVTDIDGNSYDAVQIGNQVWMAENLHTSKYADGTSIPKGKLGVEGYYSDNSPYFYIPYNTEGFNYDYQPLYGYLYNWPAAMQGASSSSSNPSRVQGVCPNGWHMPSDAEWIELENYVKNNSLYHCDNCEECIAKALAGTNNRWRSSSNNCAVGNNISTNNATGFSAFPTGYYYPLYYGTDGVYTALWSSTINMEDDFPNIFGLAYDDSNVQRGPFPKSMGVAVRCVRD